MFVNVITRSTSLFLFVPDMMKLAKASRVASPTSSHTSSTNVCLSSSFRFRNTFNIELYGSVKKKASGIPIVVPIAAPMRPPTTPPIKVRHAVIPPWIASPLQVLFSSSFFFKDTHQSSVIRPNICHCLFYTTNAAKRKYFRYEKFSNNHEQTLKNYIYQWKTILNQKFKTPIVTPVLS